MSRIWKHAPRTVRPRSSGQAPLLLCLLAFALTAIVVFRWGREIRKPTDAGPTFTATVYVVPRAAGPRIPLRSTDGDPQRAGEMASSMAESYVADHQEQWKRETEEPCRKAGETADAARREHAQHLARLETFRRQLAEAAEAAAKARATARQQKPSPPTMVDNPQWLELDRQFTELQWRHDQLLADRTPLHPAVLELAGRMAVVKDRLAATPRQIRGSRPAEASAAETGPAKRADSPTMAPADREKLDALTAAVENSRQACDEAESAERVAWERQQAGPQFDIEPPETTENQPPPDYAWLRLLSTALATGVVMAFGVGSLSVGSHIEPAVASANEVQADAGAPLVGIVPSVKPLKDPTAASRRQFRIRRALVAAGLVMIAACPLLAIWAII